MTPDHLPNWERLLAAERHLLGPLDDIMTGLRQLRRTRPLETEVIAGLRVPTLAEMARIKAWLLATRHTVRDYLDTVVLMERHRIVAVVHRVPLPYPSFWLAAMARLGEAVDWATPLPQDPGIA